MSYVQVQLLEDVDVVAVEYFALVEGSVEAAAAVLYINSKTN